MNSHVPKWCNVLAFLAYHGVAMFFLIAPDMDWTRRAFGMGMAMFTIGGKAFAPMMKKFMNSRVDKKS
jgi:hypothetical protein